MHSTVHLQNYRRHVLIILINCTVHVITEYHPCSAALLVLSVALDFLQYRPTGCCINSVGLQGAA